MDRRKTVLVLDFDADLLINLERTLEDSGFSATTTWNVEEARALAKGGSFDFLVLGNRPPAIDPGAFVTEARSAGGAFGCFVLGTDDNQDGYSNLLDRIRSFPCYPVVGKKTAREAEPMIRRAAYGGAVRKSEMYG